MNFTPLKSIFVYLLLFFTSTLFASGGHFEDSLADFISWIVILVFPFGGIYLFWQMHIYPEKVAEKNNHPQLKAIKMLCLLSLAFGGLLWPFALIWANYNYKPSNQADLTTTENFEIIDVSEQEEEIKAENNLTI